MIEALSPLTSMASSEVGAPRAIPQGTSQLAPTGFTEIMTQLASSTITKVEQAENAAIAKMSGEEIPLREIVDKVMAAQQALNTTLAIRDKIVQAYIEISHIQI